jgi:hypothetical protein
VPNRSKWWINRLTSGTASQPAANNDHSPARTSEFSACQTTTSIGRQANISRTVTALAIQT